MRFKSKSRKIAKARRLIKKPKPKVWNLKKSAESKGWCMAKSKYAQLLKPYGVEIIDE